MLRKKQLWSALALVSAVAGSTAAFAQEEEFGGSGGAVERVTLEEIIVTARKRIESLQEAPLSISAFTSGAIEANNIRDMIDVANMTAGFTYSEGFGRSQSDRPVIRGQSTILPSGSGGGSGVSTFIDGVLINGPILDYDLNDVERIEVIKGPQAALYGRNTYSGAINITTKAPQDEMTGNVKVDVGTFEQRGGLDQTDLSAAIRGPLTESISGSLTGRHYKRKGPFDNEYDGTEVGGQESHSVSGALYFDVTDDLEIRTRLRWSRLNDDQPRLFLTSAQDNNCFGPDNREPYVGNSTYYCGEIEALPLNVDDRRLLGEQGFDKSETWESSVAVEYAINDEWTLISITGYNTSDSAARSDFGHDPLSFGSVALDNVVYDPVGLTIDYEVFGISTDFTQDYDAESTDFSTELQFQYEGDTWSGLVGAYYYSGDSSQTSHNAAPEDFFSIMEESYNAVQDRLEAQCPTCTVTNTGGAFPGPSPFPAGPFNFAHIEFDRSTLETERENVAIFGMVEHEFTDRLSMSLEARFASETIRKDEKNMHNTYWAASFFPGNRSSLDLGPSEPEFVKREKTFRSVDPRFSAKYMLTDDVNLYAVIATGTKPGGISSSDLQDLGLDQYDEETVLSYEVGVKTTLLDGRMTFNAALYHNTIDDYQMTESVIVGNESVSATKNAGEVRLQGLELETVFTPESLPGLILTANYAYNDAEFQSGADVAEGQMLDVADDGLHNCSALGLAPGAVSCDGGDNAASSPIAGRKLPLSPEHMANIGASYTADLSDAWVLVVNGNASFESKKFVQAHNEAWTGSRTLLNASIALENESFRLALWGKNLTDDDTPHQVSRYIESSGQFQRAFMGTPRTGRQYGLTGTYMF